MSFQIDMCCLCLNSSTETLHHLNEIGDPPEVSYYEKINWSLSKLDFKNEYAEDYMLCVKCCSIIDNIYEFNNSSIRNIDIMTHYMTLLSSSLNKRCKLVVDLSDCCDAIINKKDCIKLEDTINSKVADAIVHNTDSECETMEDNSDIILHLSDDAFVSTGELVSEMNVEKNEININNEDTDSCADDIDIKEELDIKIEEPEVVANYLMQAYELSDFNNTPVSDSLQANDGVIFHQPDDGFVVTAGWVNDVEDEYNDCKVDEEHIETEEYADGTPGRADPINAAVDASPHGPICSEENATGDLENEVCNISSELTEHTLTGIDKGDYVSDRKCSNRYGLMRHRRIHSGEKPYVCEICNKQFSKSCNLIRHKRIHTGEKPYVCELCNKEFTYNSHLVTHKRIHTGEKPHVCEICNKQFSESSYLVKHTRIHTSEKPYACEICNKRFSHSGNLLRHKRIHTGEKPHVCEVCKKRFSENNNLVKHSRIHTSEKPYVCEICNKRFTVSSTLVRHKRIHTGEKPYVCEICNKPFSESSNLVRHKRMHTSKKSYM